MMIRYDNKVSEHCFDYDLNPHFPGLTSSTHLLQKKQVALINHGMNVKKKQ